MKWEAKTIAEGSLIDQHNVNVQKRQMIRQIRNDLISSSEAAITCYI